MYLFTHFTTYCIFILPFVLLYHSLSLAFLLHPLWTMNIKIPINISLINITITILYIPLLNQHL